MFPHHLRRRKTPEPKPDRRQRRGGLGAFLARTLGFVILFAAIGLGGIILGPGLPDRYNPMSALDPTAPAGPFTALKLARLERDPEQCFALLDTLPDLRFVRLPDRNASAQCHIRGHAQVRGLSQASLRRVSTRCSVAVRLYMWERHVVQPAALRYLGGPIAEIEHLDSYSCRRINTPSGPGESMSSHARAQAIDISAVVLENQNTLTLQSGWMTNDINERAFWRQLRNGACDYFRAVLSPDFNQLHADHFHLQEGGYSACR